MAKCDSHSLIINERQMSMLLTFTSKLKIQKKNDFARIKDEKNNKENVLKIKRTNIYRAQVK